MDELSVTEHAILGILAEAPSHGFAISKQLEPAADLGRILTVRRPLVYRALDRLADGGFVERGHTEKSNTGPSRRIFRGTRSGHAELARWLDSPVDHVREIRIEFLLKLALLNRAGRSPRSLIAAQRQALQPTLTALDDPGTDDHVEMWRRHIARAASSYLEELAHLYE